MTSEALAKLYSYNHFVVNKNTEGVSQEESLHQPRPAGNCLNWVVGHLVAHRNIILGLVGEPPVWNEEEAAPYARGSAPLADPARAHPLPQLLADFNHSQERLLKRLGQMSESDLAAPVGEKAEADKTLGSQLAFFQFHEAYHAGQLGILRRLAGKEGAIR
jgi:uncharacterized damage-inducible protein DinB